MHIGFIKIIDPLLGRWIIIPLLVLRRIFYPLRKNISSDKLNLRKVLILKFWGMGTILQSLSAIEALKKKYPDSKITILTLHQNKDLCKMIPLIDEILCIKLKGMTSLLLQTIGMLIKVRSRQFDVLIDLEFFSYYTAIFTILSGIQFSIGFATPNILRNPAYLKKVSFDHSRHISAIFMKAMEYIIGKQNNNVTMPPSWCLQSQKDSEDKIKELLERSHMRRKDLLLVMNINASALSFERRWPKNNYLILAQRLLENFKKVRIVLIGNHSEEEYTSSFLEELKNHTTIEGKVLNLCGRISMSELNALFQRADLFIGNDSGPLHLASFMDVPTVSFFGPETPLLYGPVGDKHYIFYEALPCSPCLNVYNYKSTFCEDNKCMKDIDADKVYEVIKQKYIQPRQNST